VLLGFAASMRLRASIGRAVADVARGGGGRLA
jgi:hypothetical protein